MSPNYALAYAGLADVYANRAYRSSTPASREHNYELAKTAALKAIEIDGELAEAHASLGFILRSSDWEITTAQRLDPLSLLINADLAEMYIFARKPEQAIEVATKALEMNREFLRLHMMLMWAQLEARMLDDAIREAKSSPENEGRDTIFPMSILSCSYANAGQPSEAWQVAERLLVLADQYSPALVQAAATCSSLGDNDHAFALIERALAVKNDRLLWLKVDPRFDNLRKDDRYAGLLHRMNLPK